MSIEIRPATAAEMPQLGFIGAYVYGGAFGDGEDNLQLQSTLPEWTLCAFDGPRMVASYATIPFTMRAQGRAMALGGVTSVGTLPEYRRRGLARKLTTQSFEMMREAGQSVAALWASQAAIYQRYGYAQATVLREYTIDSVDIRLLQSPPDGYGVSQHDVAGAFDQVKDLYRRFVDERVCSLHRAAPIWSANAFVDNGKDGPVHVALARNPQGEACGYMVYTLRSGKREHPSRAQELVIRDTAWLDIDAYRALWEFVASHDLVGRVVSPCLPADDPTPELLAEPRLLNCRDREGIWFRIVSVVAALEQRGYQADGAFTVQIPEDDITPWNGGTYAVSVEDGQAQVQRTTAQADVVMPIKALASAYTGARRVSQLASWGLVTGDATALDQADRVLATRFAPHLPDHF